MNASAIARLLCAAGLVLSPLSGLAQPADPSTAVWIFTGLPGDEEHHAAFEQTIARLRDALLRRCGIPPEDLTVLYGPESAGYDGVCTRERLLDEMKKAVAAANTGRPVWLIFLGHSNPTAAGANFNIPGPDASARDLRDALAGAAPAARIAIVFTTSSSGKFLGWLSAPGRLVLTATLADEEDNETEFPHVLADVLENPASDRNDDGRLSLLEIFLACNAGVKAVYDEGEFLQREHAMLDGNGDRRGTQRPVDEDAAPAERIALPLGQHRQFD